MSKQKELYYANENHGKKYYNLLSCAGVDNDIERETFFTSLLATMNYTPM